MEGLNERYFESGYQSPRSERGLRTFKYYKQTLRYYCLLVDGSRNFWCFIYQIKSIVSHQV